MKMLFKFRYPKLSLLILSFILAYYFFSHLDNTLLSILGDNYFVVFIAGMLFTFGFTTPFAIGYFATLAPENIWLTAAIGGIGALCFDFIIFGSIKFSFLDEFNRLKKTKAISVIHDRIKFNINEKIKNYILYIFAGIIIASPLPDEVGVTMLAGLTKINPKIFALISWLFNSLGIAAIILIAKGI
jgi:hypothetical protein